MTLVFLAFLGTIVGYRVANWWAPAVPLTLGAAAALLLNATGHSLADSPLPFLVAASTVTVVSGVALAHRRPHRPQ